MTLVRARLSIASFLACALFAIFASLAGTALAVGPPTVTSVAPTAGSTAGGTTVTITGTGFTGVTSVAFGGVPATSFTINSDALMTATSPAGTGTVDITVTSTTGTSGVSAADQFTYTSAAPTISGFTPPYGTTAGGTLLTITGTGFTGATGVTVGGTAATNLNVVSATSITVKTPAHAAGFVSVVVTTPAGTGTAPAQYRYEAPTPVVTSVSPATGSTVGGTNITVRGSNFTGATRLDLGTPASNFVVVDDSTITATTPANAAGHVIVTVVSPGGENTPNIMFTYVTPPSVTGVSPSSGTTAGGTFIAINGSNLTGTTAVTVGGVAATGVTVVNDSIVDAIAPAGAAGTASVVVTTPGGPSAANSFYTYVNPPTISSVAPAAGPTAGGQTITLTGTNLSGTEGVTIAGVAATGVNVVNDTTVNAITPAGTAGTASVIVTTQYGANAANTLYTYVTRPTVTSISPNIGTPAGGTAVTITGTNLLNATVQFGPFSATVTANSATSITATAPAEPSMSSVDVTVTTSGGTSATSSADVYSYYGKPLVIGASPNTGTTIGGTQVTIGGVNFIDVTSVSIGGTNVPFTVNDATHITISTLPHAAGAVSILVTNDVGTNVANTDFTFVQPAPVLDIVLPASGTTAGGTAITITGTSFTGTTSVTFGGAAATNVTVLADSIITATTPAHAAGPVSVLVTTPHGTNTANTLYSYVTPAPTVTGVSPAGGSTLGGTSITITGTNFTGATGVTIGGAAATNVAVVNATTITATTPAGSAGPASIVVTTPAGVNAANTLYTYVTPAPTVTSILPASGPIAGGTLVTISGTNLAGATGVTIGGNAATNIFISNAAPGGQPTITATTPAGAAGLASVLVTTPGGTNAANTLFRYLGPAPTISSVTPTFIAQSGGTITITGANFTGATAVQIGANTATSFNVISATQISAVAPAGPAGTVGVSVTTTNGTSTASAAATVTYAAAIVTTTAVPTTTLTQGVASTPFTPVTATGGGGTLTYALSGGTLPAGLAFATTTGAISGTPTATLATTTFTVTVSDTTGASSAKTFMLSVIPPAPTASAKSVVVTGGTTPATIDLTSSVTNAAAIAITVPPQHGTAVVNGFIVSYTPAGAYFGPDAFTYDASSGARTSAPAVVTITIASPTLAIAPTSTPAGATNVAYTQTFTTSGGTAPYRYAVTMGTLPPGLTLSTAGVLSGTPTVRGTYGFTISATDSSTGSGPFTAAQAYTLVIAGSLPIAPVLALSTAANMPVVADLTSTATNGPFTAATVVGITPMNAGSAVVSAGAAAGSYRLTFTPTATFSGAATITYTLSNANGTSAPATITIQVAPRANLALDPDLRGLVSAQTEAAIRFAQTQISNVQTHLEQLHSGAAMTSSNGITATVSDAVTQTPMGLNAGGTSSAALSQATASGRALRDDALLSDGAPSATGVSPTPSDAAKTSRIALWSAGNADFGLHDSTADVNGFRFHTSGLTVGADDRISPRFTLGADLGFAEDRALIGTAASRDNATDYLGSVYGSFHPTSQTYVDAIAGYGSLHYSSQRSDATLGELESGNRTGNEFFGSVTTSFVERRGAAVFTPYVRIDALTGTLNAFTESGGIDAAAFDQQSLQSLRGTLGTRLDFNLGKGASTFTPHVRAELQHEFDGSGQFQVQYADDLGGATYGAASDVYAASHLLLGVGVDATASNLLFSIEYTFNADGTTNHTGSFTVKFVLRHI